MWIEQCGRCLLLQLLHDLAVGVVVAFHQRRQILFPLALFRELARALGPELPVWGVRALGLEEGEEHPGSIEGLAEAYLPEILALAPQGPWFLGGASMGGMVAQELALIAPGRRTRGAALRQNAAEAVPIIGGAALMLLVAAGIEAFWSPRTSLPPQLKYSVGIALWFLLFAFFLFAGRNRAHG